MRVTFGWIGYSALTAFLVALPAVAQRGHGAGSSMGRGSAVSTGQMNRSEARPSPQGAGATSARAQSAPALQAFERNPRLSSRIQPLLPPGTAMADAATGFKNSGQFLAALHVAHNLDVPFQSVKQQMMAGDSLGKVIQTLKPSLKRAEVKLETGRAEDAAHDDLEAAKRR